MKLDGFGLFVENMTAMVRFNRDVLGFEIQESEDAVNVYLLKTARCLCNMEEKFSKYDE